MLLELALFVVGIPLLWKGAEWLVDGGASIARRLGVSSFVIGLTVVSFGTSAPEFVVNVLAATRGETDLAIGTIVGSNIANTTLILGIATIIRSIQVTPGTLHIGVPFTALITVATFVLINDDLFDRAGPSQLGHGDGIILLVLFLVFMWHIAQRRLTPSTKPMPTQAPEAVARTELSPGRAVLYTIAGVVALALGGEFLVRGALVIATTLGLTSAFVGFAIVAIGTSLPELAASAAASWKSEVQLVVGNIIGSNIFNLLWILGITALIRPIPIGPDANMLLYGAFGATILLWVLLVPRRTLSQASGYLLVAAYVAFLGLMLHRTL